MARISLGNQGQVFDARLQSDGKLVFGGVGTTGAGEQAPALARLTTAGQPDEDFGFEGVALGPPPSGGGVYTGGMAVAADGKLLLVDSDSEHPLTVSRFTTAGQPDTTFSGDGRAAPYGGEVSGQTLLPLPDGSVLVGGSNGSRGMGLARLRPDGSADPEFAGGGAAGLTDGGFCDESGC